MSYCDISVPIAMLANSREKNCMLFTTTTKHTCKDRIWSIYTSIKTRKWLILRYAYQIDTFRYHSKTQIDNSSQPRDEGPSSIQLKALLGSNSATSPLQLNPQNAFQIWYHLENEKKRSINKQVLDTEIGYVSISSIENCMSKAAIIEQLVAIFIVSIY